MITTRIAHVTRIRLAATAAALTGLAFALTGCGDGNASASNPAGNSTDTSNINGTYLSTTEGQAGNVVIIDGKQITYVELVASDSKMCGLIKKVFADVGKNKLVSGNSSQDTTYYQVMSKGTINDADNMVTWDDDNGPDETGQNQGTGSMTVHGDTIDLQYVFASDTDDDILVSKDSDQGKALVAKYCG